MTQEVADTLRHAKALIDTPEKWCQGAYTRGMAAFDAAIAALESATEGSRELDEQIATLVWGEPQRSGNVGDRRILVWWHKGVGREVAPNFTTSLDAVIMLMPEGLWNGKIMWNFGDLKKGGFVELNLANPRWLEPDCEPSECVVHAACVDSYEDQDSNEPPRPRPLALAACIAILKARRAMAAAEEREP